MRNDSIQETLGWVRKERMKALKNFSFIGRDVHTALGDLWKLSDAATSEVRNETVLQDLRAIVVERHLVTKHDLDMRCRVDQRMRLGLKQLGGLSSSSDVSRQAPDVLRKACGFTRVMISSVRGSKWLPDTIRYEYGPKLDGEEFERFAQDGNEIPLVHMMRETEMLRNQSPIIVEEASTDPRTYKPLMRVTQSDSYIAAPIVVNRRTIGFFHADRHRQSSAVTSGDLKSIEEFATEFGFIFESAVLRERIENQRRKTTDLLEVMTSKLADLNAIKLPERPSSEALSSEDRTPELKAESRTVSRLSTREQEVLALLAAGATNRAIAEELVLSLETVKGHVASILRKLRVPTRAAAVAKHHRART